MENILVGFLTVLEFLGIFIVAPIIIALIIISLAMIGDRIKQNLSGSIQESIENLVCSVDADCPEGYLCIGGRCIPQKN